jgi:hypothetical protein
MGRAAGAELPGKFGKCYGFASRNGAGDLVDAAIERRHAAHIEVTSEKSLGWLRSSAAIPSIAILAFGEGRSSRASGFFPALRSLTLFI